MATTLLIQSDMAPFAVSFPAIAKLGKAEFYAFCQANPELRIEQTATGEVVIMSPASSATGNRNFNLVSQLGIWAEKDGTGLGFDSSTGFTLPNGATRSPDAAWMRREKWDSLTAEEKDSFAPICPDFVIELRSKSDSLKTLQAKLEEYIENGVALAWLIDCQNHTVHIYRPQQTPQILENPETVSADPELQGFTLALAKIW
jgi:Uma2 family endonuclease